jgi:probable F420-dependent oxidoreductase
MAAAAPGVCSEMQIHTTVPVTDVAGAGVLFRELEAAGYDGASTFETNHDPFIPLALAAQQTTGLRLGTAVAIAFARNPMNVAQIGSDLQLLSRGRFTLGLGSQIRPHIQRRYSMPWSHPAARMREFVLAVRAIWDAWDGGGPLEFRGEFYTHTLMTPVFDPGPNPWGRARIGVGGVGPRMLEVAASVGDTVMLHPFNSRASLEQLALPAVERGLRSAGRDRSAIEVMAVCLIVTGATGPQLDAAVGVARSQLAFYASTPAYAPVLACHGWESLHPRLNAMSKDGRWSDMSELVPDDLLESIAVVGRRDEIAAAVTARVAGVADIVSLECTRRPDAEHFADIVAALKGGQAVTTATVT